MIHAVTRTLAAAALLSGACSPSPGPALRAAAGEAELAAEALGAGDYVRAADLYRRAVGKAPDRLPLHYGLAVAASHLDLQPEAIREFRWVVQRGEASKAEVENARKWLVKVGVVASPPRRSATLRPDQRGAAGAASVEGRAVSAADSESAPVRRLQIFLIEQPSREHYYQLRTDEDGRFRFPSIAPGIYKLSDRITGPPTWRLRVEARPGQVVFLDLGPGNSTRVRDDFPEEP